MSPAAQRGFNAIQGCCSSDVLKHREITDYPSLHEAVKETILCIVHFCEEHNMDFHDCCLSAEFDFFMEDINATK